MLLTLRDQFLTNGIDFMPIGKVTETGHLVLLKNGHCLYPNTLWSMMRLSTTDPEVKIQRTRLLSKNVTVGKPITKILNLCLDMLIYFRRWIYEQYDSQVILTGCFGGDATVKVHGSQGV